VAGFGVMVRNQVQHKLRLFKWLVSNQEKKIGCLDGVRMGLLKSAESLIFNFHPHTT
jgi:hypothetical protein